MKRTVAFFSIFCLFLSLCSCELHFPPALSKEERYEIKSEYMLVGEKTLDILDGEVIAAIDRLFVEVYPVLADFFDGELQYVKLVADSGFLGTARVITPDGEGSIKILELNPEKFRDLSQIHVITHELAHIAASMHREVPMWIREGVADYARYKFDPYVKESSWNLGSYEKGENYTGGYKVAARFFLWVEENLSDDFTKQLCLLCREGYSEDVFKTVCGQNLEELWENYVDEMNKE